jgi:hypothetical protein
MSSLIFISMIPFGGRRFTSADGRPDSGDWRRESDVSTTAISRFQYSCATIRPGTDHASSNRIQTVTRTPLTCGGSALIWAPTKSRDDITSGNLP